MNDDRRAMLNNIIANPGDDLPRLVYCDWLEEREDLEACGLCHGSGQNWQRNAACVICDGVACVSNGFKWQADLIRVQCEQPDLAWSSHKRDFGKAVCIWQRGFIHDVKCTMSQWESHGPAICREHPVERVEITEKRPESTERGWTFYMTAHDYKVPDMIPLHIAGYHFAVGPMHFLSVLEANDWLSRRCVAWARSVNR